MHLIVSAIRLIIKCSLYLPRSFFVAQGWKIMFYTAFLLLISHQPQSYKPVNRNVIYLRYEKPSSISRFHFFFHGRLHRDRSYLAKTIIIFYNNQRKQTRNSQRLRFFIILNYSCWYHRFHFIALLEISGIRFWQWMFERLPSLLLSIHWPIFDVEIISLTEHKTQLQTK